MLFEFYSKTEKIVATLNALKHRSFKLKLKLFFWEVAFAFIKFLILVFKSPGQSFNMLTQSHIKGACDVSYMDHVVYQKKIKLFSLAGISTVVCVSLIISFVFNYVMPGFYFASAKTNAWEQSDWSGGLDNAPPYPVDPGDLTDWDKYGVELSATIEIAPSGSIRTSDQISALDQSDVDFGAGDEVRLDLLSTGNDAYLILDILE